MARLFNHSRVPRDRLPSRPRTPGGAAGSAVPASLARWLLPAALAAAIGAAAMTMPSPARAGDDLVRVLVDMADVIFRTGTPYYRDEHGRYERLVVVGGPYGPQYYRHVPRGHYDRGWRDREVKCNRHGKCKVEYSYYDPRHDRDRWHGGGWDRDHDRQRWYGRHDRDDRRHDDRHRVRYRLIRAHGGD